jgi:hypothetical protein
MAKKVSIEDRQFAALEKRLAAGRVLTAAQMQFVKDYTRSRRENQAEGSGDTARGVTDLARRLRVNRQVINWHRGRNKAPKDFSVSAWREYLLTHGKGETIGRVGSADLQRQRDSTLQVAEDAALAQFHAVSNELPHAVTEALRLEGVSLSPEKLEGLTFAIFIRLAATQQAIAERQGINGVFDTDEEGVANYPARIVNMCMCHAHSPTDISKPFDSFLV